MQNSSEVSKSTILSFKPRQVILLAQQSKTITNKEETKITPSLDDSLLYYFHRNGFRKTVKRFQSEAQFLQGDAWKASPSSLRLEDIFCKYIACDAASNKSSSNKPVLGKNEALKTDNVSPTNEEKPTKKKKKKGTVEGDYGVIEDQPEVTDKKNESSKSGAQMSEDTKVDEQETKPKKKKKTKHNLDSSTDELEKPVDDTVNGLKIDDLTMKSKDKKKKSIEQDNLQASTTNEIELVTGVAEKERKKKKKKLSTESAEDEVNTVKTDIENEIKLVTEVAEKGRKKTKKKSSTESAVNEDEVNTVKTGTENEIEFVTEVAEKERMKKEKKKKPSTDSAVNEDEVNTVKSVTENESISKKEKKSSKKRKISSSDDDENVKPITELTVIEEFKRQKTEISKENSKSEGNNAQETSNKLLDEQTNGKVKLNGGENSGALKSKKKERNATAEPKTVNAFQRVKIEQVEFAHEKLQDNSYWAKDGAEIGYGAKAQEVLGQVRGRDFRHEKTKKKCGSYTGGLIDLQSHSVKFSYSDEE